MKFMLLLFVLAVFNVSAQEIDFLPEEYEVVNLGDHINTDGFEYAAVISFDGRAIYYATDREGSYEFLDTGTPSHDIWKIDVSDNLTFSDPIHLPSIDSASTIEMPAVNTKYHEGNVCFSADYKMMFIVYTSQSVGYGFNDIFYSVKTDSSWTTPKNIGPNLNSKYSESMPNFSPDGSRFFFVSNRPDREGGSRKDNFDIWCSDFDFSADTWDVPYKIEEIASDGNEEAPFALADGKTLIFAADDIEPNYGGYDLYYTQMDELTGKWSAPKNLGEPINSEEDDRFFAMSPTGEYAIITSSRDGTEGALDLFLIDLRDKTSKTEKE